jgi:glycosyltransferase involved in cell wall biosynthesis
MFRNGLVSIMNMSYDNWHLHVIDDGSDAENAAEPIMKDVLGDKFYTHCSVINTFHSLEDKKAQGGSKHVAFMNRAIRSSDADYAVMISDDDGLHEDYLKHLNIFYNENPKCFYSFCHVIPYDPQEEKPDNYTFQRRLDETRSGNLKQFNIAGYSNIYVNHTQDIPPVDVVDATQVSWSIPRAIEHNAFMDEVELNADRTLFSKLYRNFGLCKWNKCTGPYKGFHDDQLAQRTHRLHDPYTINKK